MYVRLCAHISPCLHVFASAGGYACIHYASITRPLSWSPLLGVNLYVHCICPIPWHRPCLPYNPLPRDASLSSVQCVCARRICTWTCKCTNEKHLWNNSIKSSKLFPKMAAVMVVEDHTFNLHALTFINVRLPNFSFSKLWAPQTRWCVSFDVLFQNTSCHMVPHSTNKQIHIHTVYIYIKL